MNRVQGTAEVKLIECVNPAWNKWRIRWDVQKADDGSATYMETGFTHKPTVDEIKTSVIGWYNSQIETAILSGFSYDGCLVWLSSENQFNYKAAYDLAVQTNGQNLPVVFKLGEEETPTYKTFDTLEALTDFYTKAMGHIQATLQKGWKEKDNFRLDDYDVN